MENMIKRIIDMDKKAREITETAQREKLESEKEIVVKAAQLREEYLARARRRIQINGEADRTIAEQKWRKRQAYYDRQKKKMDELFSGNGDQWVETIVQNVLT